MQKFSTWKVVCLTTFLLFGGIWALALVLPDGDNSKLQALAHAPIALFIGVGIAVYVLEGLVWTVGAIELGARLARSPRLGAAVGVGGYGFLSHWAGGSSSVIAATWIALVLNCSYLVLRQRCKRVAIVSTVGHKLAYFLMAAYVVYTYGA
jgi:hypothetical protein